MNSWHTHYSGVSGLHHIGIFICPKMILIISLLQFTLNYLHVVYQRYEVLLQQRVVGKALAESEKLDFFLNLYQ